MLCWVRKDFPGLSEDCREIDDPEQGADGAHARLIGPLLFSESINKEVYRKQTGRKST